MKYSFSLRAHIMGVKRGETHAGQEGTVSAQEAGHVMHAAAGAHWRAAADSGAIAALSLRAGMGLGGTAGRFAGNGRDGADSSEREVMEMKVRMVCFKAPKFLSGLLRLLAGKRRGT